MPYSQASAEKRITVEAMPVPTEWFILALLGVLGAMCVVTGIIAYTRAGGG